VLVIFYFLSFMGSHISIWHFSLCFLFYELDLFCKCGFNGSNIKRLMNIRIWAFINFLHLDIKHTSAKFTFYIYILYLFKFIRYKRGRNHIFVNNKSSFMCVGPKSRYRKGSIVFLYYERRICTPIGSIQSIESFNGLSFSSRLPLLNSYPPNTPLKDSPPLLLRKNPSQSTFHTPPHRFNCKGSPTRWNDLGFIGSYCNE